MIINGISIVVSMIVRREVRSKYKIIAVDRIYDIGCGKCVQINIILWNAYGFQLVGYIIKD